MNHSGVVESTNAYSDKLIPALGRFSEHTTGSRIWCMSLTLNVTVNVTVKRTAGESVLRTLAGIRGDSRLRSLPRGVNLITLKSATTPETHPTPSKLCYF